MTGRIAAFMTLSREGGLLVSVMPQNILPTPPVASDYAENRGFYVSGNIKHERLCAHTLTVDLYLEKMLA